MTIKLKRGYTKKCLNHNNYSLFIASKIIFFSLFLFSKTIFASEECSNEKNLKIGLINNDYIDYQYYLYYELGNYVKENNIDFELAFIDQNIDKENMFNSPDGLKFDKYGRLWIQTDGNYSNSGDFKGMGNNQMLIADTNTGKIKRFMVGPKECEVTGLTFAPDYKTVFVGIQHPGERLGSNFPDNGNNKPRSCIIAIQKKDGSEILT